MVEQNRSLPKDIAATVSGVLTCNMPSVAITGTSSSTGAIYSWLDPEGLIHETNDLSVLTPGAYTLKVKDPVSECFDSVNVAVEQDIEPPLGLTASVSDALNCSVTSVLLSASVITTGVTYSWIGPNGFYSNEQNAATSFPGDYGIEVINIRNGCNVVAQVTVIEEDCP